MEIKELALMLMVLALVFAGSLLILDLAESDYEADKVITVRHEIITKAQPQSITFAVDEDGNEVSVKEIAQAAKKTNAEQKVEQPAQTVYIYEDTGFEEAYLYHRYFEEPIEWRDYNRMYWHYDSPKYAWEYWERDYNRYDDRYTGCYDRHGHLRINSPCYYDDYFVLP